MTKNRDSLPTSELELPMPDVKESRGFGFSPMVLRVAMMLERLVEQEYHGSVTVNFSHGKIADNFKGVRFFNSAGDSLGITDDH